MDLCSVGEVVAALRPVAALEPAADDLDVIDRKRLRGHVPTVGGQQQAPMRRGRVGAAPVRAKPAGTAHRRCDHDRAASVDARSPDGGPADDGPEWGRVDFDIDGEQSCRSSTTEPLGLRSPLPRDYEGDMPHALDLDRRVEDDDGDDCERSEPERSPHPGDPVPSTDGSDRKLDALARCMCGQRVHARLGRASSGAGTQRGHPTDYE